MRKILPEIPGAASRGRWFVAALLALLATVGTTGCKGGGEPALAAASTGPAASVEATFDVHGMHCASCPVTVRAAAEHLGGVVSVRVDMDLARAWVTYDPKATTPAAIAQAITDAGYPATPDR